MGCRLHHASKYQINYKGGWFNWNAEQFKAILDFFEITPWECTNQEDDYGAFELSVDALTDLEKKLKEYRGLETYDEPILATEVSDECGYHLNGNEAKITYHNLDDWVQEVKKEYDKSNSFIHFEWF